MRHFLNLVLASALVATSAHGQDAGMQRRMALAERYLTVTHKEERLRNILARGARLTWNTCADDACRFALNKAIESAVNENVPAVDHAYAQLIAARLTEDDLNAAISFAQSPHGQAILAAEAAMDDDFVKVLQPFALKTSESIRHAFCATQEQACAAVYARFADKPAARP